MVIDKLVGFEGLCYEELRSWVLKIMKVHVSTFLVVIRKEKEQTGLLLF